LARSSLKRRRSRRNQFSSPFIHKLNRSTLSSGLSANQGLGLGIGRPRANRTLGEIRPGIVSLAKPVPAVFWCWL
jgi:hypothetical protein